jgi:hypothetical protein
MSTGHDTEAVFINSERCISRGPVPCPGCCLGAIADEYDLTFIDSRHRLVYTCTARTPALSSSTCTACVGLRVEPGIARALAQQSYLIALLDLLGHARPCPLRSRLA